MSKPPFIKKVVNVSVVAKKQPLYLCFDVDKYPHLKLFYYELALRWVVDVRLREVMRDKYQELEDTDEVIADTKKFNKALELGLFNDFEDVINKIYEENRRK